MLNRDRPIVLTPSPKAFFRNYAIGILLSPLLIGLYLLWKTEIKRRSISYRISQNMLTIADGKFSRNIDLDNIIETEVRHESYGVGTVIVSTSHQNYSLIGLEEPEKIARDH
ncbi:MAG: hypothetical protein U5K71_05355 [Gracilimonas sp.]|nr:hypothetical protein [Gracilimonas sp.]